MGSSMGGWEEAQVKRAQEVSWGILCSQKKQNPSYPQGNDNCEGTADVPEVLTRSTLVPHGSIVQHSHSSPMADLLLGASRTEVSAPIFQHYYWDKVTKPLPPWCLHTPDIILAVVTHITWGTPPGAQHQHQQPCPCATCQGGLSGTV